MGRKEIGIFVWCHFCVVRKLLGETFPSLSPRKNPHLANLFATLITALLFLILIPAVFLPLALYKQLVRLVLFCRHGRAFHRLLTGCDIITMLRDEDGIAINLVVFVETGSDVGEFFAKLRKKIWAGMRELEPLFSVRRKALGFLYSLGVKDVRPDEVFIEVKAEEFEALGEEKISEFLTRFCVDSALPRGGKFNWDLIYTPVVVNENHTRKMFFVLRVHHCLVDGLALYNLMKTVLASTSEVQATRDRNARTTKRVLPSEFNPRAPSAALTFTRNPGLETPTKISFKLEPSEVYVPKIKEIKNMTSYSFNAIVFAAYSAALAEFYRKNMGNSPESLTLSTPLQINAERFAKYFLGNSTGLGNDYGVFDIELPVIPRGREHQTVETYILERLQLVHQEFENAGRYLDLQFNYMFMNTYFGILPWAIASRMVEGGNTSLTGSCFPGGPTLELCGDVISDYCFVLPVMPTKCGLAIYILSYAGRLQVLQLVDKRRFGNSAEGWDRIVEDFFKYLDVLHREICKRD